MVGNPNLPSLAVRRRILTVWNLNHLSTGPVVLKLGQKLADAIFSRYPAMTKLIRRRHREDIIVLR